jgi:hypothetical protein
MLCFGYFQAWAFAQPPHVSQSHATGLLPIISAPKFI